MQVPNKLASLVPKEVVRRPPRSQVQRRQFHSCCACQSSVQLRWCWTWGSNTQVAGGASADAGPMTSASQLQLAAVVRALCSSPLVRRPEGVLLYFAQAVCYRRLLVVCPRDPYVARC